MKNLFPLNWFVLVIKINEHIQIANEYAIFLTLKNKKLTLKLRN